MFVLGLGHKARHGKNWVAQQIVMHCAKQGIYAKEYSFAAALKAICRVQFGMTTKDAPLLQMVGTDLYRRQHPNIWADCLRYQLMEEQPKVAIITDVRFPNEVDVVRTLEGYMVKVSRIQRDGEPWVAPDRSPTHPSETALDDYHGWDWSIVACDGELEDLRAQALSAFADCYSTYMQVMRGEAATAH